MESTHAERGQSGTPTTGAAEATYATYTWNFGDGTARLAASRPARPRVTTPWLSPCAASEFHSYQYGGTYTVTLTVTDVGGNVASYSDTVTVAGPPPPPPPAPVRARRGWSRAAPAGSGAGPAARSSPPHRQPPL